MCRKENRQKIYKYIYTHTHINIELNKTCCCYFGDKLCSDTLLLCARSSKSNSNIPYK